MGSDKCGYLRNPALYLTSKPTSSVNLKKNNSPCFDSGGDLHKIYNSRLTGNYMMSHKTEILQQASQ